MKLNKSYLIEHKDEISNTIYCECKADCSFQNSTFLTCCYKSMIYKFSQDKELIFENQVIDIDRNYVFEEHKIQLDDVRFKLYFNPIGNLLDLINYLEGE